MDHAGIATQSKVESNIYISSGKTRHDFGRDEFLKIIWDWKRQYSNNKNSMRSNGIGLDYQRERFTLDKKSNKAVNNAFIKFITRD